MSYHGIAHDVQSRLDILHTTELVGIRLLFL